ncbi:Uncharacterized protein TPAR_03810 [Tolypocladium paradoxum]|uniref:Choline transport protein n=1 Tax=Tolypocladium paradoxum TaxID=94208 RepID=A0A2S4L0N4_9HYPO|nr:Uncharacterized protein TPAR_03810 [Tolypocladium paradoxum]
MTQGLAIEDVARLDDLQLKAAGYQQSMPRQFSIWSLGALSFTLTCTWLGTGSSVGISLAEASTAGTVWTLPIAAFMTMIVAAGMAELASAYPVAGAQYYWSFMVASDGYKEFWSFFTAWITILGWWLGAASVSNFISSMALDIVVAWHEDYEPQHWQQYLIYVALVWLAVAFNILASGFLPLFNKMIFILSAFTLGATTIVLFVCARDHHSSASFMFTDTRSQSGWSSDGWTFMLAVGNAVYAYLGSDCGAHLCEEIPNPAKNVPVVILYPLLIGLITTIPFAIALVYSVQDIAAVFNSTTGVPLFEIYYQGTGSRAAASVLLAFFAFCFFGCLVAVATTSSRTLWAVSRDGALPWSQFWMGIHPVFKMPLNAMLLSGTCISIYGVIFIGSTTAFSAMASAAIVLQQTSCVIPQAILLYRGRDKVLPQRYFNLGRLGAPINAISVAWVGFLDVLYCLPTVFPVTPQNMSWVSVVCVGLVVFVIVLWFTTKRGEFTGPHIDFDLLNARRMDAVHGGVPAEAQSNSGGSIKCAGSRSIPHLD